MTPDKRKAVPVVIEDLNLSFGDTHVLKGVDLSIEGGEFFAFLGPSGSGKSTLLRAIAGFGPSPSGRILIGGESIADLPPWKRDVGMVFQSYALWPHMTVRKNVAFGLEERRLPKAQITTRVDQALDMVGLRDLADRRPSQLSGGQQQRIALARTIVVEPKVLLLDEPLSNLDANLRIQMRRDIRELQQNLNLTTIFVTHDQEEANTTSDRLAVLDAGVIQQVGTPMELYDTPRNLFVAKFLGTANVIDGVIEERGGELSFRSNSGIELGLDVKERGAGSIVFRPQNVSIVSTGTPATDTQSRLSGDVRHMEFLGSIIRYAVDVDTDMVLIDHPHTQGEATFNTGVRVDLLVERNHIQVVSA
ncbi:Molybdenum transport ATP-binding protein ModC (TC 3.A.1.8.1) [hydrothermal vent metagenome]|uniref:Molybdenum transport ATP-binding protein ModC (TC 3.A.1.8.1) n=1 Tax=hydrothermal vent metagenome TaxID=652676 RepID=A0A3B0UGJ4_9ZZZZ